MDLLKRACTRDTPIIETLNNHRLRRKGGDMTFVSFVGICILLLEHGETRFNTNKEIQKQDSDALLRDILLNYYNALELRKQKLESGTTKNDRGGKGSYDSDNGVSEEFTSLEDHEQPLKESEMVDTVIEYIRDHIRTRIWSGLSSPQDTSNEAQESTTSDRGEVVRIHSYQDPGVWWQEDMDGDHVPEWKNDEDKTKRMVNRIFTATGFGLSFVVLVVFFIACTYCWCIGNPSKMLGTLSTILAVILLLHRLHEFFLVFSLDDLNNVSKAFVPDAQAILQ
jgi:hypothetical protein